MHAASLRQVCITAPFLEASAKAVRRERIAAALVSAWQVIDGSIERANVPRSAPVNSLWPRHTAITNQLIELGRRQSNIGRRGASVQKTWRQVLRKKGCVWHGGLFSGNWPFLIMFEIILTEDGIGESFAEEFASGPHALGDLVAILFMQWPGGSDRGLALIA